MLRLLSVLLSLIFVFSASAEETMPRYVSENVYVYMHSGPGSQYKILGSVAAGRKISLFAEAKDGYSKIIDNKGREGWIKTNMISSKPSFRVTVPKLEAQISELSSQLSQAKAISEERVKQVQAESDHVMQQVRELTLSLKKESDLRQRAEKEVSTLKLKLADNNKQQRYQFWREGGLIAGAGLLLGLILVYLPRPGRKKQTSW
ncbi:MAG: TIGR04211 family SH3 domain-containing protein [Parashewanella sp.]